MAADHRHTEPELAGQPGAETARRKHEGVRLQPAARSLQSFEDFPSLHEAEHLFTESKSDASLLQYLFEPFTEQSRIPHFIVRIPHGADEPLANRRERRFQLDQGFGIQLFMTHARLLEPVTDTHRTIEGFPTFEDLENAIRRIFEVDRIGLQQIAHHRLRVTGKDGHLSESCIRKARDAH